MKFDPRAKMIEDRTPEKLGTPMRRESVRYANHYDTQRQGAHIFEMGEDGNEVR